MRGRRTLGPHRFGYAWYSSAAADNPHWQPSFGLLCLYSIWNSWWMQAKPDACRTIPHNRINIIQRQKHRQSCCKAGALTLKLKPKRQIRSAVQFVGCYRSSCSSAYHLILTGAQRYLLNSLNTCVYICVCVCVYGARSIISVSATSDHHRRCTLIMLYRSSASCHCRVACEYEHVDAHNVCPRHAQRPHPHRLHVLNECQAPLSTFLDTLASPS